MVNYQIGLRIVISSMERAQIQNQHKMMINQMKMMLKTNSNNSKPLNKKPEITK